MLCEVRTRSDHEQRTKSANISLTADGRVISKHQSARVSGTVRHKVGSDCRGNLSVQAAPCQIGIATV